MRILLELKAYWIIVLYLSVFFGVFATFERLLLAERGVVVEDYGIAIIKALVLGKLIVIAEKLGFGGRFRHVALSIPTLWNTLVFAIFVAVFHFVEVAIKHLLRSGASGLGHAIVSELDYRFLAHMLIVFFAFIPFFAVRELTRVMGEGKLSQLFFERPWPL